jgi:hypothetical protein
MSKKGGAKGGSSKRDGGALYKGMAIKLSDIVVGDTLGASPALPQWVRRDACVANPRLKWTCERELVFATIAAQPLVHAICSVWCMSAMDWIVVLSHRGIVLTYDLDTVSTCLTILSHRSHVQRPPPSKPQSEVCLSYIVLVGIRIRKSRSTSCRRQHQEAAAGRHPVSPGIGQNCACRPHP